MISPIWARFPAATQLLQDAVVRNRLANHVKETWETILGHAPTQVNATSLLIPLNNAATPKTK